MNSKIPYYTTLVALVCVAVWVLKPVLSTQSALPSDNLTVMPEAPINQTSDSVSVSNKATANQARLNNQQLTHLQKLEAKLQNGYFQSAANYINDHHAEFSSAELEEFKILFLKGNTGSQRRLDRLRAAAKVFDDLESWSALAEAAQERHDWQTSFAALMRASELENSSPALEAKLENLIKVTSYLRANLEKRGDKLGIKSLYQQVYKLHSNHPRFQLELAYAHLRLNETAKAERLLSALQYDPELGEVAQQALKRSREAQTAPQPEQSPAPLSNQNDLVVPLVRAGNSFFIDTTVNNRRTRLLLDTGASISALSKNLISRLKLSPTGQVINLNTANGTRQARLFRTKQLKLGDIQLDGLVVAEINLENNSGFEGLLGTDALNQIDSNYSYLIDNSQNALIFRKH